MKDPLLNPPARKGHLKYQDVVSRLHIEGVYLMKDRSILLNDHMVRAVLQGRKTVARFAVEGAAAKWLIDQSPEWVANRANELCPNGQPGDRLGVRENTEAYLSPCGTLILSRYTADKAPVLYSGCEDPEFNGSVAHWDYLKNMRPGSRMQ